MSAASGECPSTAELARNIVLVGGWRQAQLSVGGCLRTADLDVRRCDDDLAVTRTLITTNAGWLLIGDGITDHIVERILWSVRDAGIPFRLGILGDRHDWRRCERWVRLGCDIYLDAGTSPARVIEAMDLSARLDVQVIDTAISHALRLRAGGAAPRLTRRERDVLDLLGRGLRNCEISSSLHISENTVEYHVRHLLEKLGARNRLEAYRRAMMMGLT